MTNKLADFLKKKAAPIIVAGGLAASVLTGCKETKTRHSNILYEDAVVTSMNHRNAWIQPIKIGKITSIITHPAINKIDFDGKIDFEINNREVYNRFHLGDLASISYREEYSDTYDDTNGDGKRELTGTKLKGYEFIDAEKK